jgi:hypothetical protein
LAEASLGLRGRERGREREREREKESERERELERERERVAGQLLAGSYESTLPLARS